MSLPLALSIHRKNKLKMKASEGASEGVDAVAEAKPAGKAMSGPSMMDAKMMVQRLLAKKMAMGGEVEAEDDDMADDFLSDEESSEGPLGEGEEIEDREEMNLDRGHILSKILSRVHSPRE